MITHTWLDSARLARLARRGRGVALALAAVAVTATPAAAAVVTVTDCVNDSHIVVQAGTDSTRLEVGTDDLVIACPLEPLGGTNRLVIAAANVTIQGPAGRLAADGAGTAVRIAATGTITAIDTVLEASDGNGAMDVVAGGDISFAGSSVTVGATGAGGDLLLITCTGAAPDCTITALASSFKSREIDIIAVGDVLLGGVTITTNSPRDRIEIVSLHGNVDAGTGTAQGQQGPANKCLGGTGPVSTPSIILGGPESDLLIQAFGFVDLSGSRITVAQNVDVMSGVGGGAASVPAFIDLTAAAIRNDIGKRGEIVMVADETLETITIEAVLLIDDDESAGVNDVSELNGCEVVPRAGCPNVVGTPSVDS